MKKGGERMTAYDELKATIARWRAQCEQIEAQIQNDSEKAVVEQAALLKKLRTGVKSMVAIVVGQFEISRSGQTWTMPNW